MPDITPATPMPDPGSVPQFPEPANLPAPASRQSDTTGEPGPTPPPNFGTPAFPKPAQPAGAPSVGETPRFSTASPPATDSPVNDSPAFPKPTQPADKGSAGGVLPQFPKPATSPNMAGRSALAADAPAFPKPAGRTTPSDPAFGSPAPVPPAGSTPQFPKPAGQAPPGVPAGSPTTPGRPEPTDGGAASAPTTQGGPARTGATSAFSAATNPDGLKAGAKAEAGKFASSQVSAAAKANGLPDPANYTKAQQSAAAKGQGKVGQVMEVGREAGADAAATALAASTGIPVAVSRPMINVALKVGMRTTAILVSFMLVFLIGSIAAILIAASSSSGNNLGIWADPAREEVAASIPSEYLTAYYAAAAANKVPWAVIAGLGKVQTDHGRTSPYDITDYGVAYDRDPNRKPDPANNVMATGDLWAGDDGVGTGGGTAQSSVGPDGCPTKFPSGTYRGPEGEQALADLCADAVKEAASPEAALAIKWALSRIGSPYACGGEGRNGPTRYDCSSLAGYAYQEGAGVRTAINKISAKTYNAPTVFQLVKLTAGEAAAYEAAKGYPVPPMVPGFVNVANAEQNLRPGDLVAYQTGSTIGDSHIVMYLGDGLMVHTNRCGDVAHVTTFWGFDGFHKFLHASRLIPGKADFTAAHDTLVGTTSAPATSADRPSTSVDVEQTPVGTAATSAYQAYTVAGVPAPEGSGPHVCDSNGCGVRPIIGKADLAGKGPFLIRPAALSDGELDPQNVEQAAMFVAGQMSQIRGALLTENPDRYKDWATNTDAADTLWTDVLDRMGTVVVDPGEAATNGLAQCSPPNPDDPVDVLIQKIWTCRLASTPIYHVTSAYRADTSTSFTATNGLPAQEQSINEALRVAYAFSHWGKDKCDPGAPTAGVFPLTAAQAKKYGGSGAGDGNRCDPAQNIAIAAELFAKGESVPVADRATVLDSAPAEFLPMVGGWWSFRSSLGDWRAFATGGPAALGSGMPFECAAPIRSWVQSWPADPTAPFAGITTDNAFDNYTTTTAWVTAHSATLDGTCTEWRGSASSQMFARSVTQVVDQVVADPAAYPTGVDPSTATSMFEGASAYWDHAAALSVSTSSDTLARLSTSGVGVTIPEVTPFVPEGPPVSTAANALAAAIQYAGTIYGDDRWKTQPRVAAAAGMDLLGLSGGVLPGNWANALPAAGKPYAAMFEAAGQKHGVDPRLIAALVTQESSFSKDVIQCTRDSSAGAKGIVQFMPATSRSYGIDPCNPAEAIDGAARYLLSSFKSTKSVKLSVASYNAGLGAVKRYAGVPPYPETKNYVTKVLGFCQSYGGCQVDSGLAGAAGGGGATIGGEVALPVARNAYNLTGRFGSSGSRWRSTHTGLDFAAPSGTPVHAVTSGVVTRAENTYGWAGKKVEIRGPGGVVTWYAHMSSIAVAPGQTVAAGTVIGGVGTTGNSTGNHLHLEIRPVGGAPVNPEVWLAAHKLRP